MGTGDSVDVDIDDMVADEAKWDQQPVCSLPRIPVTTIKYPGVGVPVELFSSAKYAQ